MSVEQQYKDYRNKMDEKVNSLKTKLDDQSKKATELDCHVLKLQSELKTMDMNLTMKEQLIKRNKDEIGLLNEQNQRLTRTMETESRNTAKITEEYMGLREDLVQSQIALEASRKRTTVLNDELRQLKSEAESSVRNEGYNNLVLDTLQQMKQQMAEQKLGDEMKMKADLKSAQLENEGFRTQIEKMNKEREDVEAKLKEKETDLAKKLEDEKQKVATISQELQRVKSRQLLGFSKGGTATSGGQSIAPMPTSPGRNTSPISNMEVKRLNDEIRQLKAERERLQSQMEDFKKIAVAAEKRMNESMENTTKQGLLKDKEIAEATERARQLDCEIATLKSELQKQKTLDGSVNIQQLHAKVASLEAEAKALSDAVKVKDAEIEQQRNSYRDAVIQHGKVLGVVYTD